MGTVTTLSGDIGLTYDVNGELSASDASAFWARLPEKVAIALVKAAPKVATKWKREHGIWFRHCSDDPIEDCAFVERIAADEDNNDTYEWGSSYPEAGGRCETLKDAKAAADAHLRANGWLLEGEVEP